MQNLENNSITYTLQDIDLYCILFILYYQMK